MVDKGSSQRPHRFCRSCGTPVSSQDTFCSYCGNHLVEDESGDSAASRKTAAMARTSVRDVFSRLRPANAGREILAGILVTVVVAGLLVGLVYALLALRGVFADPSVPRTLGLVVFSLIHGGAISASVPAGLSLLGVGGSLELGLPITSFALLPFVALLALGRVVARRTATTVLFACATAITYALVVGVLAALSAAFAEEAGEGAAAQFGADPFSTAWRAFLLALLGVLLGAAVTHGPLLPVRFRQVIRGALAAIGISLSVTVLLGVILSVAQGADAPTQQVTDGLPTQFAQEDSPAGGSLSAVGVLFALLPAILGTLWLFAHGLPMGLQGAQDLANLPLVGPALADAPLQVSLVGSWPGGNAWRLLLLGPVLGLVAGGMLAARGAPRNERWWQGALMVVAYTAFATIVALLCRITAEFNVAAFNLDLAFGASLPWLLVLLPIGGALGALGGLLTSSEAIWAPNPRRTSLAAAIVSALVFVLSLPSVLALTSQGTSQTAGFDLADSKSPPKTPAATPKAETATQPSADSSSSSLDPAFTRLLPTLQQLTTAPIILPATLPTRLKNVAIGQDQYGSPRSTSGDRYTILFLAQPPSGVTQPYVHATTLGTLTASPQPRSIAPGVTTTSRGTVDLLNGVEATLQIEEGPQGSNMGTRSVGTFEKDDWTYTLDLPAGGSSPPELVEEVLSTMVAVPQSENSDGENSAESEAGLRRAVTDYYEAVERKDWGYTYDNLDSETQQSFTRGEWIRKNQDFDNADPLVRSTPQTIGEVSTSSPVEVTLAQTFGSGATGSRTTYFVWEDGSWKHRFSQEEYDLFLADS
jgi:hypothetical protein